MKKSTIKITYTRYPKTKTKYLEEYPLSVVKLNVHEVFEALKENGFEHLRTTWFGTKDGKISGGCILGQAALNLNLYVTTENIYPAIDIKDTFQTDINSTISQYSLESQLDRFLNRAKKWDYTDRPKGLASTIIHWNDKEVRGIRVEWALPTYQDVVDMAYDVMKPYFRRVITVIDYQYDAIKPEPVTA